MMAGGVPAGAIMPVQDCASKPGMLSAIGGGAAGPWLTGLIHDRTGSYALAFWISLAMCFLSALAIWRAAPGKVRAVAGKVRAG